MSRTILSELVRGDLNGATSIAISDKLTEFPRELFALEDSLEILDLSKNQLTSLPADFGRFKKLKIAFFSDNLFEIFPEVLSECPELGIIAFKSNLIRIIPENAIPVSTHWLTMTNNAIEKLPDSIGKCVNLRKVGLAGNQIERLPQSMKNCIHLELLRISANKLKELPHWLVQLPQLRWLAFSGNPCTHSFQEAEDLEEIHWERVELKEILGQGASGVISRASLDSSFGEDVAVKLFKGEVTSDGLPIDEMNASIAAGDHTHLVPIKGKIVNHPEEFQGVVMELIPQRFTVLGNPPSLESCTRDVLSHRKLSMDQANRIYDGIASAVNHLHSRGILHGDIYAHNTFFDDHGHAILGDLGAATLFDPTHDLAEGLKLLDLRALRCFREDLMSAVVL